MGEPELVAVKATEKRFRALKHEPTGATLDEHGDGMWPPDSFTHRLREEGAIKLVAPEAEKPAPARSAKAKPKRKAVAKASLKPPAASGAGFAIGENPGTQLGSGFYPAGSEALAETLSVPESSTLGDAGQES